jgi:hypothetical protein
VCLNFNSKKTATLSWSAPTRDGGSKITGYVVEKREAGTEHWQKALTYTVPDTQVTLNDLNDNTEYEFRIRAQNKAGESEPSTASLATRITEFPGI